MKDRKSTKIKKNYTFRSFVEEVPSRKIERNTLLLMTILGVVAYYFLHIYIVKCSKIPGQHIGVYGILLPSETVVTIVSQLEVLILISFIIFMRKVGFLISTLLLIWSIVESLVTLLYRKQSHGIQGVVFDTCTYIMILVIYAYVIYSQRRYKEVCDQRGEIQKLCEKISRSEQTLIQQKNQLQEMNEELTTREEELNQLAYYDQLTGLPNRRMMIDRLDVMIRIGKEQKRNFSVVFVDIDNFKKINDSAGHLVGDEILKIIAERWKQIRHRNDILSRLGGDEFAILVQRPLDEKELIDYIVQFRDALNERIYYQRREFYVRASFGISMYPKDGETSELLLKYADVAMYQAKSQKSNTICFFNRDIQEKFQYNVLIENYLQQVLVRNELFVVFQPQYYGVSGKLHGFEALARWTTKRFGAISPKDFIPIAEENGMIISMGEWILRESCIYCKNWMDTCNRKFILSVNVSAVQLLDAGFLSMVERVLNETQFDPYCLVLEVTESTFITSMNFVVEILTKVKERGIKVALDDFGTGYASLSYLQNLPIDIIKIDKSFIDNIATDDRQRSIVESVVNISHQLSLQVIAEGVEEQDQLDILKNVDCNLIQGYLLGKPIDCNGAVQLVTAC